MPTSPESARAIRPAQDYQNHLDQGRFMLLKARGSGKCFFYPRIAEPGTGDRDIEWVEASGRGAVYAVTVIGKKPPTPNYNVVLVDLEEGPRVMSSVVGVAPEDVTIGMAVKARIDQVDGKGVLYFEPAAGE